MLCGGRAEETVRGDKDPFESNGDVRISTIHTSFLAMSKKRYCREGSPFPPPLPTPLPLHLNGDGPPLPKRGKDLVVNFEERAFDGPLRALRVGGYVGKNVAAAGDENG